MPIMADVIQEKQKISAQLAKVDAERSRLQDRLAELEVAERVLSRFGRKGRTQKRGGRVAEPQSEEPAAIGQGPRAMATRRRAARPGAQLLPLGEATLRAVRAHSRGISAEEVRDYLAKHFELTVRPNHLGMALQRHRRAGLLEIRDGRWHALQ
jgi:hypothetical protein